VGDGGFDWPSYEENAEGYALTRPLMEWFLNHYVDDADRTSPKMAPLRAAALCGLPPAMVVTCEFDPLRDQGDAYAKALADAGVPTAHVQAHGQIHISVPAVGQIVSSIWVREEMGNALRGFFA
ncbi:MAG: alpha/beta hydrolase fold domain-containing protein, partial [Acidimicrobiales bacterium]